MKILLFTAAILFAGQLYAQKPKALQNSQPLPSREVSGIVQDSLENPIGNATVILTSKADTLTVNTSEDGVFVFSSVKSAVFVLAVSEVGFITSTRRYLNNDQRKAIILDPIVLYKRAFLLKEVQIEGKPSIVYKRDTVEYRASDYKVRDYATIDELLKKMEGMEVANDGTLTQDGQQVTKVKLNGKDYAGGNVAQAIQMLPADIVEKIQIIDDYGNQAAKTGIQNGDPKKTLNIVTRADRSVGNVAAVTAGDGSDSRYDEQLMALHINGNQQLGFMGDLKNTVNGVANNSNISTSGVPLTGGANNADAGSDQNSLPGSGGTSSNLITAFNFRDQITPKIQLNASYIYNSSDIHLINNSLAQQFSTLGASYLNSQSDNYNSNKTHNFILEFEYNIDEANYLIIIPSFIYNGSSSNSNLQLGETGLIHQNSTGITTSDNTNSIYQADIFFQHKFNKRGRNISFESNLSLSHQNETNQQNTNLTYFRDSTNYVLKDSLFDTKINRTNLVRNYKTSITYQEPISSSSQLEFNAQLNYTGNSNNAITGNIGNAGAYQPIDSLSNNYRYSFTEGRLSADYHISSAKYIFSGGLTGITSALEGNDLRKSMDTKQTFFKVVPVLRLQYQFSSTQQFSAYYTGSYTIPTYNQIQPVPDYTNPQDPILQSLSQAILHT